MDEIKPDLDMWAFVEMFGHLSFAGHVTSKPVGSFAFLQVNVCDGKGGIAFTKFIGPSSVFSMTPTDEKTCQRIMSTRTGDPLPYIPALPKPIELENTTCDRCGHIAKITRCRTSSGDEVDLCSVCMPVRDMPPEDQSDRVPGDEPPEDDDESSDDPMMPATLSESEERGMPDPVVQKDGSLSL